MTDFEAASGPADAQPADPEPTRDASSPSTAPAWIALVVFVTAVLVRLLFWQATPDAGWAHSVYYKGDAPMWARYAATPDPDGPFPLGVPLRPPGVAVLLSSLGGDVVLAKIVWCLLGAATAALLYLAARPFGLAVALLVGLGGAGATQLMILSTSLNNEAPYLLLVALVLWVWIPVEHRARPHLIVAWGGANALACLLRVEHALFFVAATYLLAIRWNRRASLRRLLVLRLVLLAVSFSAFLVPWHLRAWERCAEVNRNEPEYTRQAERRYRALAASIRHIEWSAGARSEAAKLPAFCRRPMVLFVGATVAARGRDRVEPEDFLILEEAFGYVPEPIDERPFVALYGGLNFYLANDPTSDGGFTRRLLDRPPTLAGGARNFPAPLLYGLPPESLTLTYPPHLEILNRGYPMGVQHILDAPGPYLRLVVRKLRHAWRGAVPSATGWAIPVGDDGTRRRVDLVVPTGTVPALWRALWLALAAVGVWRALRLSAAKPWLIYLAARGATVVGFFGYARQGALVLPVLVLLAALAVVPLFERSALGRLGPRRLTALALGASLLLVAFEATRWMLRPTVRVDGVEIRADGPPWPLLDHRDRRLEIESF